VVQDALRSVLLPLWNSYSFFVTYANEAEFEPVTKPHVSNHPLDRWMRAQTQDLVNRMTEQLDNYDLSATCGELFETIDALTNWYIRLSRRRFAGKDAASSDRQDALTTLYDVLLTIAQLLAPFCPFITEEIYQNLVSQKHGSIHLTDWPAARTLTKEETALIEKHTVLRRVVSLGLRLRSDKKVKIRQPLTRATVAVPSALLRAKLLSKEDMLLLSQELNVKEIQFVDDPGSLAQTIAQVDARKVGPRLGGRVQEIIQAGKRSEFEVQEDGSVLILDERLTQDEVTILYRGREGQDVAGEGGIVVALDTTISTELELEGKARDLIRQIQKLRKEQGYSFGQTVSIGIELTDAALLEHYRSLIEQETQVSLDKKDGAKHQVEIGDGDTVTILIDPA
jgi:isoleucyl-tRNA synthetase